MDDSDIHILAWELIDLATHLRQERLFTISEQANLQELNNKVAATSCNLCHLAWITWQQRICVNKLTSSRPDCSPIFCCRFVNALENTRFIESHKVLGHQESIHCTRLLEFIKYRPILLAKCLSVGDQVQPDKVKDAVDCIISGLYECCLLTDDKVIVLKLLLYLTKLQLVNSDDPRRLMRHKSCAFVMLYSSFHEGLYSAVLFLTASLHSPIMAVLMEDDKFWDIDIDKTNIRFTPSEKLKMFGVEGTPEYTARMQKYREWTIDKLVTITNKFIASICENMHCFPSSVCWLVRHIYKLLINAQKLPEKEVFAICVDLVFTSFICPAIVNPEAYGIIDSSISYVARFNLIQVAKILQMLIMQKYEPVDPKCEDLYLHFDKNCLSDVMNVLLEDAMHNDESLDEEPCIAESNFQLKELYQSPAAYFTIHQLSSFVNFLQLVTASNQLDHSDKEQLLELLSPASTAISSVDISMNCNDTPRKLSPSNSPSPNSRMKKTNILTKAVNRAKLSASLIGDDNKYLSPPENNVNGNSRSSLDQYSNGTNGTNNHNNNNNVDDSYKKTETVLIFTFVSKSVDTTVGLLSEDQFLGKENHHVFNVNDVEDERTSNPSNEEQICQRPQFSLSHSQDGVSEAASNHSEESSMELETEDQNDNLSDMISANVSGRGTPNISGRDTPSSQIAEHYEAGNVEELPAPTPPPRAVKQIRFDLDDKFGKFEIKNMMHSGDETVSLVSDTWSTDVLASDSENVEQTHYGNLILIPISSSENSVFIQTSGSQLPDISETTSEAWSTDVVASDSDRIAEVDTDDTASVARSDITTGTRSEIESRGEPETCEDVTSSQTCLLSTLSVYSHEESSTSGHSVEKSVAMKQTFSASTHSHASVSSSSTFMSHISCVKNFAATNNAPVQEQMNNAADNEIQVTERLTEINSTDEKNVSEIENGRVIDSATPQSTSTVDSEFNKTTDTCDDSMECSDSGILLNGSAVSVGENSLFRPSPSSSRTPIVKSISFDKTAEKGDKDLLDEDAKTKRGSSFFKNFKLAFKKPRGKPFRFDQWSEPSNSALVNSCQSSSSVVYNPTEDENTAIRFSTTEFPRLKQPSLQIYPLCDTTEDILAKYRPKITPTKSEFNNKTGKLKENKDLVDNVTENGSTVQESSDVTEVSEMAFDNVKKKLRLVLSTAEIQQIPFTNNNNNSIFPPMKEAWCQHRNILMAFLQSQLAEAINLKDRALIAHLHETLRCVRTFDNTRCRKLLESLKEDYKNRSPYLSYLMRCRQTLLSTIAHIERLVNRTKREQAGCKYFLTLVCVRIFTQKWDQQIVQFATEFQKLKLADEKNDFLNTFLSFLYNQLEEDPSWQGVTEEQLDAAKTSIERIIMSRVYFYAMFPNGDGDISRDQVLHEHMKKLSKIITPDHKDLKIPTKYHYECPWLSAQEELIAITACKTPPDKLKCILRCTQTIVNLLSFVCNTAPSADHLVPVLVYVLIKANPPSLLSTIQYINSFYSSRLRGEEHYWWVQFCSAIEFIKTMDYAV